MNMSICLFAVVGLLGMCSHSGSSSYARIADQTIEYSLKGNQYAVVVPMDGISASQAKKLARQRAAEVVVQNGGRYFTIDSEQQTQVVKAEDEVGTQRFAGNMYQELIIEKEFGRQQLQNQSMPNTNTYPAIRLVFTWYQQKPGIKAIDACTLTNCN